MTPPALVTDIDQARLLLELVTRLCYHRQSGLCLKECPARPFCAGSPAATLRPEYPGDSP